MTIQHIRQELDNRYHGVAPPIRQSFQALIEFQQAQSKEQTRRFWREHHAGARYRALYPVPTDYQPNVTGLALRHLSLGTPAGLSSTGLNNAVIFVAWALIFAKMAGASDVPFDLIRSGRVSSVSGIDTILGDVNEQVPMRVTVPSAQQDSETDTTIFSMIKSCAANLDTTRSYPRLSAKDYRAYSPECDAFMDSRINVNFLPLPEQGMEGGVIGFPSEISHLGGMGEELAVNFGIGGFIRNDSVDMVILWDKVLYGENVGLPLLDKFEKVLAQIMQATKETRVVDIEVD